MAGSSFVVLLWNGLSYDESETGVDGVFDSLEKAVKHCVGSDPTCWCYNTPIRKEEAFRI